MKRSDGPVALVPPGVVTVTSTVPAPGGLVAVICVALSTVNEADGLEPKFTAVAPLKFRPVIVTEVPPVSGPEAGFTLETCGTPNWLTVKVWLGSPQAVLTGALLASPL